MKPAIVVISAILVLSGGQVGAMKLTGAPARSASDLAPIVGVGTEPCSDWTKHLRAKDGDAREGAQWLWGYLSGYDQFRVTKNKHLWFSYDIGAVQDFIDRSCAERPDSTPVVELNRLLYSGEAGAARSLSHALPTVPKH